MDDRAVVEAFVAGAREGSGPTIHLEGDVLMLAGWWQAVVRVQPDVFAVRNEPPPPEAPQALELVSAALADRGLRGVVEGHPLMQALTYAELSLIGPDWTLWATDADAAERALATRVGAESAPTAWDGGELGPHQDFEAYLEGARRVGGLPPSLLLAVGLDPAAVAELRAALPEWRVEARDLDEIEPDACGQLRPDLVLVDGTRSEGREFVLRLRAAACGRFLPVAAVSDAGELPAGADAALDAASSPARWRPELRALLA